MFPQLGHSIYYLGTIALLLHIEHSNQYTIYVQWIIEEIKAEENRREEGKWKAGGKGRSKRIMKHGTSKMTLIDH